MIMQTMANSKNLIFLSECGRRVYSSALSAIEEYSMAEALSRGVLVGLSGGADSVMLLCFLLEYRRTHGEFSIVAYHLNHSIRGAEADADEEFSRKLCKSLEVEFISQKLDIPALAKETGTGLEECARNARYSEFANIISGRKDLGTIAVAHNSDDNAETVLLNILRGSGSRGAAGIPPVRDNIIRPLIKVSKADIVEALSSAGVSFVTDSTNLSSDYNRNYIRNEIIPALSRVTDNPTRALARLSDNLRSDDEYLCSLAREFLSGRVSVTSTELSSLHRALFSRVLKEMSGAPLSSLAVREISALLGRDSFVYTLAGGSRFVCERGVCSVRNGGEEKCDYNIEIWLGVTEIPEYSSLFVLSGERGDNSSSNVYKISIQADLSSAIIVGRLYLRPRREGDSVFYGGMTRRLKKLYNDRKIPNSLRKLIPVLCDEAGVVWLPGFGVRDDRSRGSGEKLYATLLINPDSLGVRFYLGNEFKS